MTTADLDVPGIVPTDDERDAFAEALFWACHLDRTFDVYDSVPTLEEMEQVVERWGAWTPVRRALADDGVIPATAAVIAGLREAIVTVLTIAAESTVEPADYHDILLAQMRGLLERLERAAAA